MLCCHLVDSLEQPPRTDTCTVCTEQPGLLKDDVWMYFATLCAIKTKVNEYECLLVALQVMLH